MSNFVIDNAIKRIRYIRKSKDERLAEKLEQLGKLQYEIHNLSKPFDDEIARYELQIKDEVMSMQESYKATNCKIVYRRGYTRYSWLKDKLEGYFEAVGDDISKFRTETEVEANVTVTIGDE